MACKEILAEDFAGFQLSALGIRAIGGDAHRFERVYQTETERDFRPDNDESYVVLLCELDQAVDVFNRDIKTVYFRGHASVSRRGNDAFGEGALQAHLNESVFSSTGTDDKNGKLGCIDHIIVNASRFLFGGKGCFG